MSSKQFYLTSSQLDAFNKDGYLVIPKWIAGKALEHMKSVAQNQLDHPSHPLELEAQLGYPGAPEGTNMLGGDTPRRLLGAYQREKAWQEFSTSVALGSCLRQLFDHSDIYLSQAHHNCLMTKSPRYSSDTGWHQDSRYWSFEKPELITAWLALGEENLENGVLRVIPGSHIMAFDGSRFDKDSFFIEENSENKQLIATAKPLVLNAGDILFFHCQLLHSATRNFTDITKQSLVFTYHSGGNQPIAETRSSSLPEVKL